MALFNGVSSADLGVRSWQVPSYGSGDHIQIARLPDGRVAVANSAYPAGPALLFTGRQMADLIRSVKAGEYDHHLDQVGDHLHDDLDEGVHGGGSGRWHDDVPPPGPPDPPDAAARP